MVRAPGIRDSAGAGRHHHPKTELVDSTAVGKIEVAERATGDLTTTFAADQITFVTSDYSEWSRGVIGNPYTTDVSQLRVSAVAYDASGAIVGGGFTFLNCLLAGGSSGVEVSTTSAGEVARVELYPIPSGLSYLFGLDEAPAGVEPITVDKQGFGQDDRYLGYGAILTNPNPDYAVENTMFHVTYFAADDTVLGVDEGYLELLLSGQTVGLGGNEILDEGDEVARIEILTLSRDFEPSEALPAFTAENVAFLSDRFSTTVTGQIVSPYTKDVTQIKAMAIAYNDAGEIIGGGFTYVDFVPAGGKAAVEVRVVIAGTPATVELYGLVSALSDLK